MHHDPPSDLFAQTLTTAAPAVFEINAGRALRLRRNLEEL